MNKNILLKVPADWEIKKIEDISQVNPKSEELSNEFLYIDLESVTGGKLIQKNIIKRKYAPSRAQRVLKKNDIIFQLVRPYQQNNYIHLNEYQLQVVASTGYAQIRTDDFGYLYQYLNFSTFCNRVLEKCVGTNYPAINSNDFSKIPIAWPSKYERNKIAKILTKWDYAIELQKQLIENLELQKTGLLQKLLTPKKGWSTFEFNEIFQKFKYSQNSLQTKDYLEHGRFPIIDQGKQLVAGFTNDANNLITCPVGGLIVFGDHTLVTKYINFDFVLGGDGTQLFVGKNGQIITFLYYLLNHNKLDSLGYSRHFSMLKEKTFNIPNISKQKELAKILLKADTVINMHSQKLDLIKRQRKALMQRLLTGAVRVNV